jgi:ssDNA-binding replication factor A large subunit
MHKPPLQKGDVVLRVDQCPVTLYNVGPKLREGPVGSLVEVTLTILS